MVVSQFSKQSPVPLYYQIRDILRREITEGNLAIGAPLASESELTARFGVSRTTVRQALNHLVAEGLIHRQQGRGTFVRGHYIEQELTALTGFVEDMLELGYSPRAEVLTVEVVSAPKAIAQKLSLPEGEDITHIERVRLANDSPVSFDDTYLPMYLGEQISREDLAVYPIFSLLEDKYGVSLVEADYHLSSVTANERLARLLGVPRDAALFRIERTAFSSGLVPVDYETLYYRGDRVRFSMRLKRKRPPWRIDVLPSLDQGQSG